ncbi:hypothetical protein QOZ80_5BG0433690 [Eleusine coracana subsp. coracana]|nr:hypothetical protein QOZ80_5BG0433690 [Eleusine coracana subsp. coracana]
MPASPSSRRSPAQDTYHKRTNSFGSVLPTKPQDDELMLFSDMQKVERENFLLEPSEDFNESIAKLSCFPEVKLGVNIPARGESHDMLNVDGDKNDYEWLLTPPETPLFRSLDDAEDQSITQISRGRSQSKPIHFSRSSTMDNTQRSTRSSASPSRLSPSPRSVARTRPSSSSSRSSPPPALQPPMPSRRSSTPPASKTLTPPRRSSSIPFKGWIPFVFQCSGHGFKSKASATSSGEDDLDSMQSIPISYSSSPAVRKSLAVMKTRTIAASKNLSKSFSPSSAPKRSFDSAVWLMDHRKTPQDRFRPLLSGVPATTFGTGNGTNVHTPMFSHSSSYQINSKADHGATFGSNMDGKHNLGGEWEADDSSRGHEDIFMFDTLDELNEECIHEKSTKYTYNSPVPIKSLESNRQDVDLEASGTPNQSLCHAANSSQVGNGKIATCTRCGKLFNVMTLDERGFCDECVSKVGNIFMDSIEQIMEEAEKQDVKTANVKPCDAFDPPVAPNFIGYRKEVSLDHQLVNNEPHTDCLHECPSIHSMGGTAEQMVLAQEAKNHAEHLKPHVGDFSLGNSNDIWFPQTNADDGQQIEPASVEYGRSRDQMDSHNHGLLPCNEPISEVSTSDTSHQPGSTTYTGPKLENTEGTGISVLLLQKSNSNKWPVQDGRAMAATNILCSEPYYARDGVNIMKRSFGRDSSSAASSSDLGSSRQSAVCFERLRSGKRGDFEKSQISSTMSRQSIASMSDMSICSSSASLCPQNDVVGDTCFPMDTLESNASRTAVSSKEHDDSCKDALSSAMECSSPAQPIFNDDSLDMTTSSFVSEVDGDAMIENHNTDRMADNDHFSTNICLSDTELPGDILDCSTLAESCIPKTEEDTSAMSQCYTCGGPEQLSDENNVDNIQMQSEVVQVSNEENGLDDGCMAAISEEDVLVSGTETNITKLPNDEEPTEAVEAPRKQIQRCFTLEEATDTILFCSSIVHDLAYKAATIALENEQESECVEPIRPAVTIVGKSLPKEDSLLKLPHRRTTNRKVKRKRLEGETTVSESPEKDSTAKDSSPVRSASGITRNSDNMKPPKLESKCNCIIMSKPSCPLVELGEQQSVFSNDLERFEVSLRQVPAGGSNRGLSLAL